MKPTLYFFTGIVLVSMCIAYKIFVKNSNKRYTEEEYLKYEKDNQELGIQVNDYQTYLSMPKKETTVLGKIVFLIFIFLVVASLNLLTLIISYSFYWNKAYRAISENKYEAFVIGHEIENSNRRADYYYRKVSYTNALKTSNRRIKSYYPKVSYINEQGEKIITVLDLGSNVPIKMGTKISITDDIKNTHANSLNINWLLMLGGAAFTGVAGFFAYLIYTYITDLTIKRRVSKSFYFGLTIMVLNIISILIINFR